MSTWVPSRFVVAPSGFKESLSAEQAADAIASGIRRVLPGAAIRAVPLVDGGEGSAATLARSTGGRLLPVRVTGPVGDPVDAHLALLGGDGPPTAMVEMAAAAGLRLVPRGLRDPGLTTTYGVGELIKAALDAGASRILVGCGDSGTCDGGSGALQALGARVLDGTGAQVPHGGAALLKVDTVDLAGLDPRLRDVELLVAVNPFNELCGDRGVARVFGPQKGASPEQVEVLAAAMEHWAVVLERDLGADVRTTPGAGASGGLGAGLAAGLGAVLVPRYRVMLEHAGLEEALADADLVLTAEGAIDAQTPFGKIPAEVARRAKHHGISVVALAGTIGPGANQNYDAGIDAYECILPAPVDIEDAFRHAREFLTSATERVLRLILLGSTLGSPRLCG